MEGNLQKMRDALRNIQSVAKAMNGYVAHSEFDDKNIKQYASLIKDYVRYALSEPLRNCDVGTAEEQANRMRQFCAKQKRNGIINCGYCPIKHEYQRDCTLSWAQMPYEAEEGGTK